MQNQAKISIVGGEREENSAPVAASQEEQFPAVTGPGSTLLAGGSGVVPFFVNDKMAQSVGTPKFPALVWGSTLGSGQKIFGPDQPSQVRASQQESEQAKRKAYVENGADKIGYESGESRTNLVIRFGETAGNSPG